MVHPRNQGGTSRREQAARIEQIIADVARRRLGGESLEDEVVLSAHPALRSGLAEALYHLHRVEQARRAALQGDRLPPAEDTS